MAEKLRAEVFIDSDNLKDLNMLFDTVKSSVLHLVVCCTRLTLTRPYCAGEIASAFAAGVKVTLIRCPGFENPSEEQLRDTSSYLELTACSLMQYNITFDHVEAAFRSLLNSETTPTITMPAGPGGRAKFSKLVDELTGKKKRLRRLVSHNRAHDRWYGRGLVQAQ